MLCGQYCVTLKCMRFVSPFAVNAVRDEMKFRTSATTLCAVFNTFHLRSHDCVPNKLRVAPKVNFGCSVAHKLAKQHSFVTLATRSRGHKMPFRMLFVYFVWAFASHGCVFLFFLRGRPRARTRRQPPEVSPMSLGVISPLGFVSRPLPQKQQSVNLCGLSERILHWAVM